METLSQKQQRFSVSLAKLILWATEKGYGITLGEAWRPPELQALYVQQGKSTTLQSKHLNRCAADLNLFLEGKYITEGILYRELGEEWERMGGRWGGRFGVKLGNYATQIGWDANHFELE